MSANVESMFSVKLVPWHGLGEILDNPPTSAEAIKAAGLDWQVERRELFWNNDGVIEQVPDKIGLVRRSEEFDKDNQLLSVVGTGYQEVQNAEAFDFFDPIVSKGYASYETAGSLGKGQKVWILVKIGDPFLIGKSDEVRQYMLLCNSHDGTMNLFLQPTPVRVVCNNTLLMSMAYGNMLRIRHEGDMKAKMAQAAEVLGFTQATFETIKEHYQMLGNAHWNEQQIFEYLARLVPASSTLGSEYEKQLVEKKRGMIRKIIDEGANKLLANADKGSAWAVYNAAVEFADYYMGARSKDRSNYLMFGEGAEFKKLAFDVAIQMATGTEDGEE